ncbi:hypothetical protein D3C80_1965430 [compost metagenome]
MALCQKLVIEKQLLRLQIGRHAAPVKDQHPVRRQNLVGIMRNHQDRVAFVTQALQNMQQLIPAALI